MSKISNALAIVTALGAGYVAGHFWPQDSIDPGARPENSAVETKKPLYWVAPMDSNFRRDKPGKSPMGMDLIPVYAEPEPSDQPGTVRISPAVEHNLGVKTLPVQRKDLSPQIQTMGIVQFNEDNISHFHTRVEGWIETLAVHAVGEKVERGQNLFALYSPELINAQEEYLLALQTPSTHNRGLISGTERKLLALGITQQQIENLRQSRNIVERLPFYANQTGYIAELNVREGMYITPNTTTLSISGLNEVWVIAEVFERQAALVAVGQPVTVSISSYPGQRWQGRINYIYPVLDEHTRTLQIRIVIENTDEKLKPQMLARITIDGSSQGSSLVIPRQAVIYDAGLARVVKVVGPGKYRSQRIQTGLETTDWITVTEGLEEGEQVVISAQFLIDSESNIDAEFSRMGGDYSNSSQQSQADATEQTKTRMTQTTAARDHDHDSHTMSDHGATDPTAKPGNSTGPQL